MNRSRQVVELVSETYKDVRYEAKQDKSRTIFLVQYKYSQRP